MSRRICTRRRGHTTGSLAACCTCLASIACTALLASVKYPMQTSCVHVETCVGQAEGGFKLDTVKETSFVKEQADTLGIPYSIVAFVNLTADDAEVKIKEHLALSERVVGVRMITNYVEGRPDLIYPQVPRNYLVGDDAYLAGLGLLDKYDLVYDIHLTVEQLPAAAACLDKAPASLKVVIDHVACGPRLGKPLGHADADEAAQWAAWRSGMAAVAKRANTFVKLSAPTVVHGEWNAGNAAARDAAKQTMKETVEIFGEDRCIVASNFPVDKVFAPCTALEAYQVIFDGVAEAVGVDDAKIKKVFHDNAVAVYRVGATA